MIHVFEGFETPAGHPLLDEMHRDRKRVFVDLLKWHVPVIDGQYEADQFDGPGAVYLVAAGADGRHHGSIRLLPTKGPHVLGSVFPELCEEIVPSGPDIYEISRGCLSPRLRAAERLQIRNQLTTAAVEYALRNEITAYSCIAEAGWFSQILSLGWRCMPLGVPQIIGRALTGALRIDISSQTLAMLQEAGTYAETGMVQSHAPAVVAA